MTSRTTAHLVSTLDDRYYDIERFHGVVGARLAAESHSAAIDQYEKISAEEGIACDFERVDGYLFVPPGGSTEALDQEFAPVHRAGLTMVKRVPAVPFAGFNSGCALGFPQQGACLRVDHEPVGELAPNHGRYREDEQHCENEWQSSRHECREA